ncbi:MAG: baseplate J/gp47 family protein, partial [bacterium]
MTKKIANSMKKEQSNPSPSKGSKPSTSPRLSKRSSPTAVDTINVNFEDEVTFILDKVEDSKEKRVLVSIPEGSDLLVSTVSLELLAEAADKKGKKIVVVTDDESGKSLARSVGITVRGSVSSVDDMAWKEADIAAENREEEIKVRREKAKEIDDSELIPSAAQSVIDPASPAMYNNDELEKNNVAEDITNSVKKDGEVHSGVSGTRKVQVGDFEMTVDSNPVVKGSPSENMEEQLKPEILRPSSRSLEKGGFVGRDFSKFKLQGLSKDEKQSMEAEIKPLGVNKPKMDVPKSSLISPIIHKPKKKFDLSFIKNIFAGKGKKKIIAIVGLGLLLVFAGGTFAASRYLPEVIITLQVDSISVEYSGEITADVNEDGIDEKDLVVPAKTEEVEKNGSDTAGTTGIEYQGEKATGAVLIYNKSIEEEVVLNAGTVLSNGGVNFVTQNSVVLSPVTLTEPATMGESDVTAQKIGDQYNLVAGTQFTVSSFNLGDVYAVNVDAFAGGSEEELRVVAQADIDGIIAKLKKSLDKEALDELSGKTEDSRWVLVEDSLEQELKGDAKSSAPAGAEA